MRRDSKLQGDTKNTTRRQRRSKFTTGSIFSTAGSFGQGNPESKCLTLNWEVLKGVGVDGAGGNLPFFFAFRRESPLFRRESPLFRRESPLFLRNLLENGEFHSDPVCTDPVENFPTKSDS